MKLLSVMSGGIDSTVATAKRLHQREYDRLVVVTFAYGAKQAIAESTALKRMLEVYFRPRVANVTLVELHIPVISGSVLTDGVLVMPMGPLVPSSYVPGRNIIFLAFAASQAIIYGCEHVICGIHHEDSPYPDCTPPFFHSMDDAVFEGTNHQVELFAPLLDKSKAEIVNTGFELKVPFEHTWSCYNPDYHDRYWLPLHDFPAFACGLCGACKLRLAAFKANEQLDPIMYVQDTKGD